MSIFRRVVAGIEVDGIREIRFVRLGPILARNWLWSRVRPLQRRRFLLFHFKDFTKSVSSQKFQFVSMSNRCSVHCKIAQVNIYVMTYTLQHMPEKSASNGLGLHSIPYLHLQPTRHYHDLDQIAYQCTSPTFDMATEQPRLSSTLQDRL
jgi:hypothetical protein